MTILRQQIPFATIVLLSFCNSSAEAFKPLKSARIHLERSYSYPLSSVYLAADVRLNFRAKLVSSLQTLRAGATYEEDSDCDEQEDVAVGEDDNRPLAMVRSAIDSLLVASGPVLGAPIKLLLKVLEVFLGVSLLPNPMMKRKVKKTVSQSSRSTSTNRKSGSSKTKRTKKTAASDKVNSDSSTTPTQSEDKGSKGKKTKSKPSGAAALHLKAKISPTSPNYRIQRELKSFVEEPPEGLRVSVGKNLRVWNVHMKGVGIYKSEKFQLRVKFPSSYPTMPPSVYFLPPYIPTHEHVYTNGDICLSLLGKDWSPTLTAQAVVLSIQSILGSARSKSLPMDNANQAQNKPGAYQKDWVYHDDCK